MPPSLRPTRLRSALLVAFGLVLYWTMAVSVSPHMGVTADEVVHITGGYTYWKYNDYRLHPENGTLAMRIATLPLLGMNLKFPPLNHPDWVASRVDRIGRVFFFETGNPVDAMLLRARMAIALCGVFTVWLTWRWARGLFGPPAGWVALGLAVFSPTLLAHGGLATSDMVMTACVLGALTLVWRLLHRVTWWRMLGAMLACGAAFLSKMSGVLIVPLIGVLLGLRWLRPAPLVLALGRTRRLRSRMATAVATTAVVATVGAGSLVVLWGGYGFRYDGFNRALSNTTGYYLSWDVILEKAPIPWVDDSALTLLAPKLRPPEPTAMTGLIGDLRDHHLLPEAYLWGFAHTYKFSRERPAFLMGEYRKTGWPQFFPMAFLLKTPPAALLLFAAGVCAIAWTARRKAGAVPLPHGVHRPRSLAYRSAPLWIFFVVYWLLAVRMHLNIGHRHILPTYPVFHVFASAAVLWLAAGPKRLLALVLALAVAAQAIDSLAARPFYLSYFSPVVGGMPRGYHYLVDSSYDWGQGLPDLQRWLSAKKLRGDAAPVYLTYFGADSPRARGLEVIRFGDELSDFGPRSFPAQAHGGWYVIGATYFQRVYLPVRGPWLPRHEALYQELLHRLATAAAEQSSLTETARKQLTQDTMDVEVLQFGRLCHYLEGREPQEVIGGSLLAFRLSDAEVATALYGPPPVAQP